MNMIFDEEFKFGLRSYSLQLCIWLSVTTMAFGHMSLAFDHMNLPPQGNKELEVFILILSGPVLFPTIQRAIKHMRSQEVPTNFSYNYLYSKLPSNSDHPRIMLRIFCSHTFVAMASPLAFVKSYRVYHRLMGHKRPESLFFIFHACNSYAIITGVLVVQRKSWTCTCVDYCGSHDLCVWNTSHWILEVVRFRPTGKWTKRYSLVPFSVQGIALASSSGLDKSDKSTQAPKT